MGRIKPYSLTIRFAMTAAFMLPDYFSGLLPSKVTNNATSLSLKSLVTINFLMAGVIFPAQTGAPITIK